MELIREFPYNWWTTNLTKPDWSYEELNLWIEAKYVRKKGDLGQINEAIAADITKHGDNGRNVLFFAYDPSHIIVDEDAFKKPIVARATMDAGFLR